jgi:hypothetical protein
MSLTVDDVAITRLTEHALVGRPHPQVVQSVHFRHVLVVQVRARHVNDRMTPKLFRTHDGKLNSLDIGGFNVIGLRETGIHDQFIDK